MNNPSTRFGAFTQGIRADFMQGRAWRRHHRAHGFF
jgi:hypothetical protein